MRYISLSACRAILRAGISILAFIACAAFADPPLGSIWQLTFSDDFEGTSLDTAKWRSGNWNNAINGEPQGYQASQISVANGKCVLTCEVKSNIFGGQTMKYASGEISTRGKFSQRFGYFEARLKVPRGAGFWPAWWGMPDDGGWPPEVDIFELVNTGNGSQTSYGTNWFMNGNYPNKGGANLGSVWLGGNCTQDMTADFHNYGMEWTADSVRYYCDGRKQGKVTRNTAPNCGFYLIVNLAIKTPNEAYMPANMEIEWVKVWKNNGPTGVAAPAAQVSGQVQMPAYANRRIEIELMSPYSAQLTDAAGRIILSHAGASPWTASMAGFRTGVYILNVNSSAGMQSQRILHRQ
jgi:beta-glucanase (GH16 family)